MGREASKLYKRWEKEGIHETYLTGRILDVGCGDDKICLHAVGYDKDRGDGQLLADIPNESFDTVFSSHFLEHVPDPLEGILNQWRCIKPGGYLILVVPDEDLYERGCFPSLNNPDHKHTFTISKDATWSPTSRNLWDLIPHLLNRKVISIRTVGDGVEDYCIETIVQKNPPQPALSSATLSHMLLCPRCARAEMKIQGILRDNSMAYTCGWCGETAAFNIRNLHAPDFT